MPASTILLNADDLGLGPAVDRGILDAWAQRAISDSTAFATAPALPATLRQARVAGLPVGVHLNLTFGRPLCDPAAIPALVTPEGTFMKRQRWALPLPVAQVRHELTRQVERFIDLYGTPSHLDSHHHVHTYPEVLAVVIELAQALRVPVRATSPTMRDALRAAGLRCPDHFSMVFYGDKATVETLIAQADACPGGTLEFMTHPGYADPDLPSSYAAERQQELRVLGDPAWRAYLRDRGIAVRGFQALAAR